MSYFVRSSQDKSSSSIGNDQFPVRDSVISATNPMSSGYGNQGDGDNTEESSSLLGYTSATQPSSSFWGTSASAAPAGSNNIPLYPTLEPVVHSSPPREMTTFSASAPVTAYASYPQSTSSYPIPSAHAMPPTSPAPAPAPVYTTAPAVRPATQANVSQQITVDSLFIEELVAENSRLTAEVEDLRKIIQIQEQQLQERSTATVVQGGRQPMFASTPTGVPLSTASYNPGSGVTTINTNTPQSNPPQPGTKHVCCGHCRKWLLVPIAANLIFCPNCERVNNCALR